jgi:hypothetical protein
VALPTGHAGDRLPPPTRGLFSGSSLTQLPINRDIDVTIYAKVEADQTYGNNWPVFTWACYGESQMYQPVGPQQIKRFTRTAAKRLHGG